MGYRLYPMKKVACWLSDEEQNALAQFCEKEGRSMYSVLKEAVARVISGEAPITPKQDSGLVAPSVKTVQVVSPKTRERFARLEREIDKLRGNEYLWQEVTELKAGVGELKGLVSGLLLKLTKTEELEDKFDKKVEDIVVGVLEKLGRPKERV